MAARRRDLRPVLLVVLASGDLSLALDLLRFGGYTRRAARCELARLSTSIPTGDRTP